MTPQPITTDIRSQMILLGTGTSVGVPVIGCGCEVCASDQPRNRRSRCSVVLGLPEGNLLIDTTPDLRAQLLRERIGLVHAVLFTHEHADHLNGLDDVRIFPYYLAAQSLPVYCEEHVERRIRRVFDYAFADHPAGYGLTAVPRIDLRPITTAPFDLLGATITPIRLEHGQFRVLGFRVGNVAYCTDTNRIPDESWPLLAGLDVLILDALRFKPHPTHFSLDEAVAAATQIGARRTYFTHVGHELDYEATNALLPAGMELAYDGLRIALT